MYKIYLLFIALLFASCTTLETVIESGKNIGNAVIDDAIEVGKTAISIPVSAVGTVVDKVEEEVSEEKEE
jgi:hypothetical protein